MTDSYIVRCINNGLTIDDNGDLLSFGDYYLFDDLEQCHKASTKFCLNKPATEKLVILKQEDDHWIVVAFV